MEVRLQFVRNTKIMRGKAVHRVNYPRRQHFVNVHCEKLKTSFSLKKKRGIILIFFLILKVKENQTNYNREF